MKILHLEASPGWGGQEMRILREAEGMRARGHEIVFGTMNGAALARRARAAGFVAHELNFNRYAWLRCWLHLLPILQGVDIVNTHSSLDAWIGGIAAKVAGKKIVRTRHLSTPVKSGFNSRLLYGTLADFVVTTCEAVIGPIVEQSQKPLRFFRSVATGIDPKKIDESLKNQEKKEPGTFLIGTACFMRSWKGIEVFLQAAKILSDRKDIEWVIIGGGHEEKYRQMAKEMNVNVRFTGHLENPFPALNALDAFALLSTANEGVSQAILQAAYLKKPLIATPTGGSPEVCLNEKTGILVPVFDPVAVADAVLKLKDDRSLSEKLGKNAHEHVLQRFTFQQTLDEMEKIFNEVL